MSYMDIVAKSPEERAEERIVALEKQLVYQGELGVEAHDGSRGHTHRARGANEMTQKTVRVRIAVVVAEDGSWWSAQGDSDTSDDGATLGLPEGGHDLFIEADIPLPTSVTVEGEVVS